MEDQGKRWHEEYETVRKNRDFFAQIYRERDAEAKQKDCEIFKLKDRVDAMMMVLEESGRSKESINQAIEDKISDIDNERDMNRW